MCCSAPKWKEEIKNDKIQNHKFDFVDLEEFKEKTTAGKIIGRITYSFVFIFVLKSVLLYVADIWTAALLLIFDRWGSSIQPKIPFSISKWIYIGCIFASFLLLAWDIRKAIAIMKSRYISFAFTNIVAYRTYTLKSYAHFCFFSKINNYQKPVDRIAFFVFFAFKGWKRLVFAEAPRQVINGITLYYLIQINKSKEYLSFSAYGDMVHSLAMATMAVSIFLSIFSFIKIVAAAILYIPLLCHIRGNLKEYCCYKIDKRITELLKAQTLKRIKKQQLEAEAKSSGEYIHIGKKKNADIKSFRQPTLPTVGFLDDSLSVPPSYALSRAGSLAPPQRVGTPGLAVPSRTGTPDYGPPRTGTPDYGPSRVGTPDYGPPRVGTPDHGPPRVGTPEYGPPRSRTPEYGPPRSKTPEYGPPRSKTPEYGPPRSKTPEYGPPRSRTPENAPSRVGTLNYGPPRVGTPNYGPQRVGTPNYGPPRVGTPNYGPPRVGTPNYGPPRVGTPGYGPPRVGTPGYGPPRIGTPGNVIPRAGTLNYGPQRTGTPDFGPSRTGTLVGNNSSEYTANAYPLGSNHQYQNRTQYSALTRTGTSNAPKTSYERHYRNDSNGSNYQSSQLILKQQHSRTPSVSSAISGRSGGSNNRFPQSNNMNPGPGPDTLPTRYQGMRGQHRHNNYTDQGGGQNNTDSIYLN
ncbi:3725_t:CDS:2 [Scutellospora calospora]|uniref:3725_t:CDS:1 n=1 Tax=Scutellospora calospora TaxID=85575 RepID=A0ACA9KHH5_9GLOM|nr:3725_t:CDS:2 [Scutellospora calospora]